MSNLAKQLQKNFQEQTVQTTAAKTKTVRKAWFSPGEKVLGFVFGAIICVGSVQIISNQAAIYEVNKDIQDIEAAIVVQQKINSDLEVQVSELSTYERIWDIATNKLGLELNDNVKVVQE